MELLQVVGGREAAQGAVPEHLAGEVGGAGQHVGQHEVRLRELEPHRVGVDLLDLALLAVDRHGRRRRGHEVLVAIDVLEPEHEVVGGEWLAVAPLHAAAQVQEPRAPAVLHLEAPGEVRHGLVARVVPEHQVVRPRAAPEAVPEVGRPREAAAPRAAVPTDLVERLDDQRVLPDALGHRRELARFDQLRQLRRLRERLGKLRGVGDDLGTLQLPDQALARVRRERPGGDDGADRPCHERERESGSKRAYPTRAPKLAHDAALLGSGSPGRGA